MERVDHLRVTEGSPIVQLETETASVLQSSPVPSSVPESRAQAPNRRPTDKYSPRGMLPASSYDNLVAQAQAVARSSELFKSHAPSSFTVHQRLMFAINDDDWQTLEALPISLEELVQI